MSAPCATASSPDWPAPGPPADATSYGKHIQRTMTLLESSSPERRPTVRILYYGQSIVGSRWTDQVDEWLRERYPHVDFVAENRAIGGFSSQLLVRTMEYDVFAFYPDLIVFHVYGAHDKYEEIVREFRRRTSAEIVLQTDHANKWPEPKAAGGVDEQPVWADKFNYFWLPEYAERYGVALQPQRWEWVDYLKANDLQPEDLLIDAVHLNDQGKWLMAGLLKRFLVHLPDEPQDDWRDLVKTYEVGKDVKWKGNRLRLEFDGNRVVALAASGAPGAADVLIDGKKPSEFPECYAFTRPSGTAGVGWPAIKHIGREKPIVAEEWTATVRDFNEDQTDFAFEVEGAVTGPDGAGRGAERFVSNSGRVVIEPDDWVFAYCKKVSKKPTPDGWTVTWRAEPMFVETYAPTKVEDPAREYRTVLVSGLENTTHTLELVTNGDTIPSILEIRVHRPPLK